MTPDAVTLKIKMKIINTKTPKVTTKTVCFVDFV